MTLEQLALEIQNIVHDRNKLAEFINGSLTEIRTYVTELAQHVNNLNEKINKLQEQVNSMRPHEN